MTEFEAGSLCELREYVDNKSNRLFLHELRRQVGRYFVAMFALSNGYRYNAAATIPVKIELVETGTVNHVGLTFLDDDMRAVSGQDLQIGRDGLILHRQDETDVLEGYLFEPDLDRELSSLRRAA